MSTLYSRKRARVITLLGYIPTGLRHRRMTAMLNACMAPTEIARILRAADTHTVADQLRAEMTAPRVKLGSNCKIGGGSVTRAGKVRIRVRSRVKPAW